jgi:4-hydroxymandelate oxidase
MDFAGIRDFQMEAESKLERSAFDYFDGGALDELTLRDNVTAFERLKLWPRALQGIQQPDTRSDLLGTPLSMPIIVAPTAFHGLAHDEGEVATASAAATAESLMVLSTTSNRSIAEVGAAAQGRLWFQLYMFKDRDVNQALIARAESAGCKAVVLTVDVPIWGRRERDMKNKFALPSSVLIGSLLIEGRSDFYDGTFKTDLGSFLTERFKFDLTWDDVDWLMKSTRLPVVLKGVMHPQDAKRAADAGVAGIVVSNHGGRQLDTAPAAIDALPRIVEAVGGSLPVILDGGVRRGHDVLKALALGATAVGIGRPIIWALAARGPKGVSELLDLLRAELANAMVLCGCSRISEATRAILWT